MSDDGLPAALSQDSATESCDRTIIVYRFLVWVDAQRVAVGFSLNPACRIKPEQPIEGLLRILLFDAGGTLQERRDLPYEADAGDELVAEGEAFPGPSGTLLLEIQEALHQKSAVLLLDHDLKDAGRIDRFMETQPPAGEHPLVFQEGYVASGARTYDIFDGVPLAQVGRVTEDWPAGAMDRKIGLHGLSYVQCLQELEPGKFETSRTISSGAHRRCALEWQSLDGEQTWSSLLENDQVAEIVGLLPDGTVAGIVRSSEDKAEELKIWSERGPAESLPWMPRGYETKLQAAADGMSRYAAYGTPHDGPLCRWMNLFCDNKEGRVMVFDRRSRATLFDKPMAPAARAALSPDGLHLAMFQDGSLNLYALPRER